MMKSDRQQARQEGLQNHRCGKGVTDTGLAFEALPTWVCTCTAVYNSDTWVGHTTSTPHAWNVNGFRWACAVYTAEQTFRRAYEWLAAMAGCGPFVTYPLSHRCERAERSHFR